MCVDTRSNTFIQRTLLDMSLIAQQANDLNKSYTIFKNSHTHTHMHISNLVIDIYFLFLKSV